jgi:adenylyl-sulfate kinase
MAPNLTFQNYSVTQQMRESRLQQSGRVVWFFGLSGAGKSTLANALELSLHNSGLITARLDGDNLRMGLSQGLGFSVEDRSENLRRAAHCARLIADSGLIVICSFITPLERHREIIREILGDRLQMIFVDTPAEICVARDPRKSDAILATDVPFEKPSNIPRVHGDRDVNAEVARIHREFFN